MEQKDGKITVHLDQGEYDLFKIFLEFINKRSRGKLVAEIVSNKEHRYVKVSITNSDMIHLKRVS